MFKPLSPPMTLNTLESELRLALLVQASHIAYVANVQAATAFLGHEVDWDTWEGETVSFDLAHFHIWTIVKAAYEYAYRFDPTDYVGHGLDLADMFDSFSQWEAGGILSPLWFPDSPLRQLADKARARDKFDKDEVMDLKELSRLLDCSEDTIKSLFSYGGGPDAPWFRASEVSHIVKMHPNFVPSQ